MRRLLTGIDGEGRSCLIEASEVVPAVVGGGHGVAVARLFATEQSPPPPAPPAQGEWVDVRMQPGLVRWQVVDHPPHDEAAEDGARATVMHHTDAIDLVLVMEGSAQLVLDDGVHVLGPGDFVVMPGNDHAIKAGPEGCRMTALKIGLPGRRGDA